MTHSDSVKNIVRRRVATAIEQYMTEHNISQGDLAARLGVHQTAISFFKKGQMTPKADTLLRMAQVFNLDLNEMIPDDQPVDKSEPVPA